MSAQFSEEEIQAIRESEAFLPEVGKGTGWRPQPADSRDFKFSSKVAAAAPVSPPFVELAEHSPVRDQGSQGACTGFGVTAAIETLVRLSSGWDTIYSPQFVYNNAREMIGELHLDEGAYVRDAVKSTNKMGAARESDFPYYEVHRIQFSRPPERAFESAKSWRLGSYYACATLQDVRTALASGYPVVGGFLCYSNLSTKSVWETGRVPEPAGYVTGGHCVFFCGYDDASRMVKFKNSWGIHWGDNGFGYLPYSFFENRKASDLWALTQESPDTQWPRRAA